MRRLAPRWTALAVLAAAATPLGAQERPTLRFVDASGAERAEPLSMQRGYATVPLVLLAELGWTLRDRPDRAQVEWPGGPRLTFRTGTPFFRWNDTLLHFADPVYEERGMIRLPVQLLTDFFPARLPERYAFDGASFSLEPPGGPAAGRVADPQAASAATATPPAAERPPRPAAATDTAGDRDVEAPNASAAVEPPAGANLSFDPGPPLVILDAGHGGADPGSMSRSGVREKAVALGVVLSAASALREDGSVEVALIRDDDSFVPLWSRGAEATRMRGNRAAVFVSVHANSFNTPARGFETYFLSEARTEHERRVAEIENAPLGRDEGGPAPDDDLDFILRELRNLDHQHWSGLLAELTQAEVDRIHPGPNRGVKQGPFAVITNALMPSVLVEIGYLSHPDEAALLGDPDFQRSAGEALARAVLRFFERYPPGAGDAARGRR